MKNWLLQRKFIQDYIETLKKDWVREASIDAFTHYTKDLEETNTTMIDEKAKELMDKRLSELLSSIDWLKVVSQDIKTKQIFIGGLPITPERLANLRAERQFMLESDMWNLINETPKAEAQNSMFVKGDSLDDLKKGKSMLFTLDQQRKILDVFK